ncbi:nucleolar complex protein 2 homolog [Cephus cinctus]|uniref:Nucleolar complex protein 2 homolog n=1 Tax=Cephus cinctus TaxID=211228 RepID=A0AAJ7VYY5_CEPCN|nr:nucleolar complex protein 2 homolog [Cephus cinctus]XP_024938403.1 nucleolar complex protein 2 homolog [Cephus cinctus]
MKIKKGKAIKSARRTIKKVVAKKKKSLSTVSTNQFFEQDFENDVDSSDNDDENIQPGNANNASKNSDSEESDMDLTDHKKSLMKLKDTDPEFYSYLKQNDKKLLDFNVSDDEDDDDDKSSVNDADMKHVPDENLEIASDESDYEPEKDDAGDTDGQTKVTLQLLKKWQEEITSDKTSNTLKCIMEAFHAALLTIEEPVQPEMLPYKVDGSAVFNGVIQLCVLHLPTALKRFLKIGAQSRFEAHKAKRFIKVKGVLKSYLTDLIKVLQNVTSSSILTVLLKHLHQMLPYTQSFSTLSKPLLRILLKLWSTGEETVRVVAFLSILRFATGNKDSTLETLLKNMYVKYVENSKFVSPTTLPGINFMRHSLVEIYLLDNNLSYNHAFLYIRQLAIHLRNAMTLKKKENFQAVYNWQYINSLRFWAELITLSKNQSMLRSLLYPLVQIITGTIKMIPTAQYYPLRFHCVQMLINISKHTDTFVPILPFVLEILNSYDFNKRHKSVTMKPLSLMCLLRMSKAQLQENGFKDSVIETVYQLILENASKDSHTIYFPDLYIPCIMQLKSFLKKCHVANYCRKIKQLMDKIEENRKYIETERIKTTIDLKDITQIKNWENGIKNQGTPLEKFYVSWNKVHQSQKLKLLTQNDQEAEYNLPTIRRGKKNRMPDDNDEGDSDLDIPVEEMEKKLKKAKTAKKKKISRTENVDDLPRENTDIVQDMSVNDWD